MSETDTSIPIYDITGDIEKLKSDMLKLINNVDSLEQRIINIDAKYKEKLNYHYQETKELKGDVAEHKSMCDLRHKVSKRRNKKIATAINKTTDIISGTSVGIRDIGGKK